MTTTLAALVLIAATVTGTLSTVADVPLPGGTTRWDYQSIDAQRRVLFIAHLGDSEVVSFDLIRRRVRATISGIARVHGVLAVPELGRVYASATGTDEVVVIDEVSLAITARIPAGTYPDGIAYDPTTHRIFVSDERGKTVTVIDIRSNRRVATIDLGGEVGNSQWDSVSGHIFSADQTRDELVEIDPTTARIVQRFALPGCQGSHGVYIDAAVRRAFIACEDNAKLVNLDLDTKKPLQVLSTGHEPDVLAFDVADRRLYVACESGDVSIFSENQGTLRSLLTTFVAPSAHSIAVDQPTHLLYIPLERLHGRPSLRIMRFTWPSSL